MTVKQFYQSNPKFIWAMIAFIIIGIIVEQGNWYPDSGSGVGYVFSGISAALLVGAYFYQGSGKE